MVNSKGIHKPKKEGVKQEQPVARNRELSSPRNTRERTSNRRLLAIVAAVVTILVVVVVLSVVLTRDDDDDEKVQTAKPDVHVPVSFDFRTGVSLITEYHVQATITQRLARTVITMEIDNAMNCTSVHGVTLQLPLMARVTSLSTIAVDNDSCKTHGDVQPLAEARDTFAESATQGIPAAYVEARDSDVYSLQVSLLPFGTTIVELITEELLEQKLGKVNFHLPLVPNEEVDQVRLDIEIFDVSTQGDLTNANTTTKQGDNAVNVHDASFELSIYGQQTSPFSLAIPNARYEDLPKILEGSFTPSVLPDKGVLFQDGTCFEHIFLPTELEPIPKNIIYLWDITTWNSDPRKTAFFQEMKQALSASIEDLTYQDNLTIQTFADQGTKELWFAEGVTSSKKTQAQNFVNSIQPAYTHTNIHEALLEALVRAKSDDQQQDGGSNSNAVTILVVLSNSWPSQGATNRSEIARDVWELNQKTKAKIFGLGSPDADLGLLKAMAIMNGGIATDIPGADAPRIVTYFQSQFGVILLSDINIRFVIGGGSGMRVSSMTQRYFPVVTRGTEIVVRGIFQPNNDAAEESLLEAMTMAVNNDGPVFWNTSAVNHPFPHRLSSTQDNSHCFQSFAHARVTQLMKLRDIALELGDYVVDPVVTLSTYCNRTNTSLADCIEDEALSLALEARLVARGLTGMVTVDEEECFTIKNGSEICLDGTSKGDFWPEEAEADESMDGADYAGDGYEDDYDYGPDNADIPTHLSSSLFVVMISLLLLASLLDFA